MDWISADGRRRGWSKKTMQATFCEVLQAREISWYEMESAQLE